MIDHVSLLVSDYAASRDFFLAALGPLGYELVMELTREKYPSLQCSVTGGLGVRGKPDLWLRANEGPIAPTHVAFRAVNRLAVDAFHSAALAAGARDNGPPGLRPLYHPNYYGAFVLGPDGYNVEAVCHEAENP
jgi:catechol 2,3-dioxygenase-like lactoylglutathione lyase family enzyme